MKQKLKKEVVNFFKENEKYHNESYCHQASDDEVGEMPLENLPDNYIDGINRGKNFSLNYHTPMDFGKSEVVSKDTLNKIDEQIFFKKYPLTPDEAFKK
jgi:hypothetical protein